MSIKDMLLKVAGRDKGGKARALKVDDDGTLHTKLTGSIVEAILEDVTPLTLTAGSSIETPILDISKYKKLAFTVSTNGTYERALDIRWYTGTGRNMFVSKNVVTGSGSVFVSAEDVILPKAIIRFSNNSTSDRSGILRFFYGHKL